MKFSYNWLKELSGTEKTPEELAEFLTVRAFEVEEVKRVGFCVSNIFVGRVLSVEKHPNADRLRIANVDIGEKGKKQIVCGAPNLDAGQNVAVAIHGAILPDGNEIRKTEIRGVPSEGMICSERELGLGENHDGIMVLPQAAEVGMTFSDDMGSSDWLLDVKILPDRAHDCLSHVGLAREISALEERVFDYDYDGLVLSEMKAKTKGESPFSISLGADDRSLRYIGALMKNVSVGASPQWLIDRLSVFGMRSINCVVDATNFIMLELGQPLHAFDWNKLAGSEVKKVGPRFAMSGETILLLDGKTSELGAEDIVIADGEKAVALGGIMGGADSAVTSETTNVLFEAAHFDPVSIRRTRTRLGIESDASFRFEKGISLDLPERAMVRLLDIISHIAGGEIAGVIDKGEKFPKVKPIVFAQSNIESLLGMKISEKEMKKALELRGFQIVSESENLSVIPPLFRLDIESEADIAEEIGKSIGYDRIAPEAPKFSLSSALEDPIRIFESMFRNHLAANGFVETYNYSFYSERDATRTRLEESRHCALENPLNPDQALVRISLVPGLLKNIALNRRRVPDIRLFECGKTYESVDGKPNETRLFSGAIFLSSEKDGESLASLKSEVSRFLSTISISASFRPQTPNESFWHPTRTAEVIGTEGISIGAIGEIHPSVGKSFDVPGRVACFEFDVRKLLKSMPEASVFVPIRKYPETLRDLSCFVPERILVADIEKEIFASGGDKVLSIELFDRYTDAEHGRSLAFHLRFGKEDSSLTGEEAEKIIEDISHTLETKLGVSTRSAG